ncbi:porphobilinogen synthase [Geoglobus acetivorans]|uniref:Delta-aminolevulinic acid dehydratase n=1 Tax=Geoglobus acetivorans TaxID=565033 RepID=A0ABZ3H1P7_GEOAI
MEFPKVRMRRLRKNRIRPLMQETKLSKEDLIMPIFVDENISSRQEIPSMPGYFRIPLHSISDEIGKAMELGIRAFIFFGIPASKDEIGSSAYDDDGVIQKALRDVRQDFDDAVLITDVCLCEYTTHGHCGIVHNEEILNDPTLPVLGKVAVSHARAGADIVAPSGMMDGMIKAIRGALDENGFENTAIMSYSAKYASSFYGPFREAAESGYAFGDRKSYQMDFHNSDEALREVELDLREGADMVMVKPALSYLDIIRRVKEAFKVPVAAYNVSGEYSMVKAAGRMGWLDETSIAYEILTSIKRAGADLIITYHAKEIAEVL